MRNDKENIIVKLTFEFAIQVIEFVDLLEAKRKYVVGKQLLKSGTSIGANVREAQNAESKADFIHKMKIAAKEVDETEYWLMICREAKNYPFDESLLKSINDIKLVLSKIISTSKRKNN